MADDEPSYIDYDTFLAPNFHSASFANSLVTTTNNPNDLPLDLSTPLSRVLFDIQEIDSHIDLLTTRSAIPLLEYTRLQNNASQRIVSELDGQLQSLNDSYKQLESEVITKHAEADQVRLVATRLWETLRLGRLTARCLQLGRQLEIQYAEFFASPTSAVKKEDPRALVRCANTLLLLREVLEKTSPGQEGHGLERVDAIKTLKESVIARIERSIKESAEMMVRDFAIPASATFAQGEEAKIRLVSALSTLYLLSPISWAQPAEKFTPELALRALETYIRSALQFSTTTLARALGQLPLLDRATTDVAMRCQGIVALELLLATIKPPTHTLLPNAPKLTSYLQPLLARLECGSLVSFFWKTLANNISTRTREIVNRGGASAKALKNKSEVVGEAMKECVAIGGVVPNAVATKADGASSVDAKKWERETALMVGAVVNSIGW
ncbi:uncharacterized protein BROUX77_003501 [Berkeleyomyces rouxiae]|uniref:uncharacterized protein n=1 Tax=Berkeleyomyces rouxiae TaxID=2035830 RepID=UPI003B7753F8